MRWIPLCLVIALGQGCKGQPQPAQRDSQANLSDDLQTLLEAEASTWKVPGAGMVAIHPEAPQTVFVTGVRGLEENQPVDAKTVFPAGSLTKAFTTSLAAIAVARGQWSWDDAAHQHLDWFPESFDIAPETSIKLWHLGSHTTGHISHDLLFYRQDQPIREGVEKLLKLPAFWKAGTRYQYQNLMVRALGLAQEKRTGQKWSDAVQKDLLAPLGQSGASFTAAQFHSQANQALPHRSGDQEQAVSWKDAWFCRNEDPCASLCLPLEAWEPWLRLHLGQKLEKGPPPKETEQILKTHEQRIAQPDAIQDGEFQPEFAGLGYGLGWVTLKYRGMSALAHGGVMDGYRAFILLIPERHAGVVVFANRDRSPMCHALACKAMDRILQAPEIDWTGRMHAKKAREEKEKKDLEDRVARAARAWKGAAWPMQWSGDYHNPAYGLVRLQIANDQASLHFREQMYRIDRVDAGQFFLFDPILGEAEINLSRAGSGNRMRIGGRVGAEFLKDD